MYINKKKSFIIPYFNYWRG